MSQLRKNLIHKLLKGIETGDPEAALVVDESKYIQHNPQTKAGGVGLAELFARLAKTNPRVNLVRLFSDGDFVFGHTEYDFSTRRIGFEVFRFEGDKAVEHWDNIQPRVDDIPSGRTMVDGPSEATELDRTEDNRAAARRFVEEILIPNSFAEIAESMKDDLVEHSPEIADGRSAFVEAHQAVSGDERGRHYEGLHRVLAEGNFALCVSEGTMRGAHAAFYDLFRFDDGRIAEHWQTIEKVAPKSEWKNDNGKF